STFQYNEIKYNRLIKLFICTPSILNSFYCILLFFFSSRRRHTRCYRDWSSDVCSSDLLDINLLADLEKSSIPTAMIGCELKNDSISSVMVDNELGAHLALEHLYTLGHRKIAFIRGPKTLADSAPRSNGVRLFAQASALYL